MKLQEILKSNDHWNYYGVPGTHGTDKNTGHSYVSHFYEEAFLPYKDNEIDLLEIGIARGDSLLLWNEYFTNNKSIIGLDNHDQISLEVRNNSKIKKIFTEAYNKQVADMLPSFDIIIDDGPHNLTSQCISIEIYLPKVKPGGIFVIEDVQSEEYIDVFKNMLPDNLKNHCSFIDLRKVKNRSDDMMFVVRVPKD